jgi:hypothetical protein
MCYAKGSQPPTVEEQNPLVILCLYVATVIFPYRGAFIADSAKYAITGRRQGFRSYRSNSMEVVSVSAQFW